MSTVSISRILASSERDGAGEIIGTTVSPFYQLYDDGSGWTWAVDVDLGDGSEVLRGVPVASNNRELFYAEQGKPVSLRKENNRWVVIGLAKTVKDLRHRMEVCFQDDIATVVSDVMEGYRTRLLSYGELGELLPNTGYGYFPYGTMGRFNAAGDLVEIIETRPL
jgi:hypothetical protein